MSVLMVPGEGFSDSLPQEHPYTHLHNLHRLSLINPDLHTSWSSISINPCSPPSAEIILSQAFSFSSGWSNESFYYSSLSLPLPLLLSFLAAPQAPQYQRYGETHRAHCPSWSFLFSSTGTGNTVACWGCSLLLMLSAVFFLNHLTFIHSLKNIKGLNCPWWAVGTNFMHRLDVTEECTHPGKISSLGVSVWVVQEEHSGFDM